MRELPRHVLLLLLGLLVLAPYIWMVSASLKPTDEIFRANLSLLPSAGPPSRTIRASSARCRWRATC
jgi:ABC-type glycerol-3-phosphate transport system permease component